MEQSQVINETIKSQLDHRTIREFKEQDILWKC